MQKNVINPVARHGVLLGLAPRHFALLETKGRKSGFRRQTPVGGARPGPAFWVVAAQGKDSAYVKNLMAEPAVRVKVERSWYSGRAAVVPDDDPLARHRQIVAANGWVGRADGVFFRASATTPISARVDLDGPRTLPRYRASQRASAAIRSTARSPAVGRSSSCTRRDPASASERRSSRLDPARAAASANA